MNNTVEAQHTDTLMKEIDLVQNCSSNLWLVDALDAWRNDFGFLWD